MGLATFFAGLTIGVTILLIVVSVAIFVGLIILVIYFLVRREKHLENLPSSSKSFSLQQGKESNKKK